MEKTKKRALCNILLWIACVLLAFAAGACGKKSEEADPSSQGQEEEETGRPDEDSKEKEDGSKEEEGSSKEEEGSSEKEEGGSEEEQERYEEIGLVNLRDFEKAENMQFQIGSTGYTMVLPRSYEEGNVTVDELQEDQVGYYYDPVAGMDFDIYQYKKPDPEMSLEDYVYKSAEEFKGSDIRFRLTQGFYMGTYLCKETYEGVTYDVLVALMEDGDEYVEIVFWLEGENAERTARNILRTIRYVEAYDLQLGTTSFYVTIPVSYVPGEITEEQAANDLVGFYSSENSLVTVDVYQFAREGMTLEQYAILEAGYFEGTVEYMTINGIDTAFYGATAKDGGKIYKGATYIFENPETDDFIELDFQLDGEIAAKQADRIISTLTKRTET